MGESIERPTRFIFMAMPWSIVYHDNNDDLEHVYSGTTKYREHGIGILKQIPEEESVTMLHELLHVIDKSMDADLTETQVERLSRGLYAMFKTNEPLRSYIWPKMGVTDEK